MNKPKRDMVVDTFHEDENTTKTLANYYIETILKLYHSKAFMSWNFALTFVNSKVCTV